MRNIDEKTMKNAIYYGVLGHCIGDAIGVSLEFSKREDLKNNPVVGFQKGGFHDQPIGTWSDDSSLVFCTMDSVRTKRQIDIQNIGEYFIAWYKHGFWTATGYCFDIGSGTEQSLQRIISGTPCVEAGSKGEYNNGNGSLMRMLPISFYLAANSFTDEENYNIVGQLSSITHAHEISILGCYIYVCMTICLINGMSKYDALDQAIEKVHRLQFNNQYLGRYQRILNKKICDLKENEIFSDTYVVSTLEASIWSFMSTNNYRDAILKAVNLGEDTDTVGAITGSLAGIYYGIRQDKKSFFKKDIFGGWDKQILMKREIEKLIKVYSDFIVSEFDSF